MKTQNTAKVILGAAMVGLLAGASVRLQAAQLGSSHTTLNAGQVADDNSTAKHGCKGQNSCKGQGGCKANDNGCKAKNDCKGKGGCATDGSKDGSK